MMHRRSRGRHSPVEDGDDSVTGADRSAENFETLGTLGVEEEFFIVDDAGRPVQGVGRLIDGDVPPTLAGDLDTEMYPCMIETKTVVCDGTVGLRRELARDRQALVEYAAEFGYRIAAAGLLPSMRRERLDAPTTGRYEKIIDRLRYPQLRNTAAGVHLHVGVDDADKAVWIANELRWYLPIFLALSANSPFYHGRDTGLASARAQVFSELPHTGIPQQFDSYADYASFQETMIETGSVMDAGQLWWDVRPHAEMGTVEIRAPDAQFDSRNVLAFAEYARALVLDLGDRYDDGVKASEYRRAFLEQNRWRALRYGHDASFIDRDGDGEISLGTLVDRECDRLGVAGIRGCLSRESGAARQRRWYERGGWPGASDAVCLSGPATTRVRPEPTSPTSPPHQGTAGDSRLDNPRP